MRIALGMAASVLCIASLPAFAGEGAAHQGDAPLRLAGTRIAAAPLGGDFRVRAIVEANRTDSLANPQGDVRRRIASTMFDYYPAGDGAGFHLSAGVRYYDRTNFMNEAVKLTNGLLYAPTRMTSSGNRAGFKRYTPAMTAGYTAALDKDLTVGIEGGAMLGRANMGMPMGLRRSWTGASLSERQGVNPVANLVVGYRF